MNSLRLVEVATDVNSPLMRQAAEVILRDLKYVDAPYERNEGEIDTYVSQSYYKGEVHRVLVDRDGAVVAVAVEGPEEEAGTVDIKRMVVARDRQRQPGERNGTRLMLALAQTALRNGNTCLSLYSRSASVSFYARLGFTIVHEGTLLMTCDARALCDRFADLAATDAV